MNKHLMAAIIGSMVFRSPEDNGGNGGNAPLQTSEQPEQSEESKRAEAARREADEAESLAMRLEQEAASARQQADKATAEATRARTDANAKRAAATTADSVVQSEQDQDVVIVNVPRAFTLRLDNHTTKDIKAGTQRLPRSQAEHWYSKNNGVTIISQAAQATVASRARVAGAGPQTPVQQEVSKLQSAAGTIQSEAGNGQPARGPWPGSPDPTAGAPAGAPAAHVGAPAGTPPAPGATTAGNPMATATPAAANTASSEANFRGAQPGATEAKADINASKSVSEAGAPRDGKGSRTAK